MICVYESTCTDFSSNGMGVVTPESCSVTETLNGEWELTLVHPIDVQGKWGRLIEGSILRAPVPAAMTPQVNLITQQYQTTTYDILIYKVSTNRDPLRLRSGTGTKYKILAKYKKGTEVVVLNKTTSSWYEVTCPDGKHGYMSSQYLTYVRTDTGTRQTHVGFQNQTIEARQLRDQPFRIYRVVPELMKITVYARHIFYDLLDNMVKKVEVPSDAVGASAVKRLSEECLSEHDFTFYSDLSTICGWGGLALNAAALDTRVKATVAATMYDMSRVNANGYFDAEDSKQARYEKKKALNAQRIRDYRAGNYELGGGVVDPLPDDAPFFVKDYYDYYKTSRGYHPRSLNSNGGWNRLAACPS